MQKVQDFSFLYKKDLKDASIAMLTEPELDL